MPKYSNLGRGLSKHHSHGCDNRDAPEKCDCSWRGRYRRREVVLAKWAKCSIDPRSAKAARLVLNRMVAAVDDGTFSPDGERPPAGTDETFAAFLKEWRTHYAEEYNLTSNSLADMLNVIAAGLGRYTLEQLADSPTDIERWLNRAKRERKWSDNTWNRYYETLSTVCVRATKWQIAGRPRMARNPMLAIEKRVPNKQKFGVRILEDAEDKLFAAVDQLNRPQHKPNRGKLKQEDADAIRARVAAGEQQKLVAAAFGVSPSTCNAIVKGEIWNPENLRVGNKGTEMRRRLIGAFDLGLRRAEMMKVEIGHVELPPRIVDGRTLYRIALPPAITKGGKTTGETEYVYAATPRAVQMIEARLFQLRDKPKAARFVFGREDGRYQAGFDRLWGELFDLAGLDWGRAKGLVWHTVRHEFTSRHAENTGDPVLTQELARHRDLKTTQGYFHAREDRKIAAAFRLNQRESDPKCGSKVGSGS